jgi:hypothetical protein
METRTCQNCKTDFSVLPEDFAFYAKINVPPPTFCPDCRMERRTASRNQRSLFKRSCSKCGADMASSYAPDSPFTVYCTDCYFKDDWDASEYSADYDFSKPFFEQFHDLMKRVPQLHMAHTNNNGENIVFSNYVYKSSNIYLSYGVTKSEHVYYSWGSENGNRMCMDSANFSGNENCYELVASHENYGSSFLTRSQACVESHFLFDCVNCTNCFMSSNLRNKSYVFRNQQLTPEEYKQKITEELDGGFDSLSKLKTEYADMYTNAIHRYATILQSENVTGDTIFNSKNVFHSFAINDSENIRYAQITVSPVVDSCDFSMSGRAELSYEFSVAGRGVDHALFCFDVGDVREITYCDGTNHVENLFGCTGLKHKKFCILNKQYSETEYYQLRDKIIEQMKKVPYVDAKGRTYFYGEYFPIELSRFPYNQTNLFELFPLTKNEALKQGYTWIDQPKRGHQGTVGFDSLPKHIRDIPESITQESLPCEHAESCNHICSGAFRVTKEELQLLQKFNLALPRLCPNCRYFKRLERILPWKLWHRSCMCSETNHGHGEPCPVEFETAYAPERPEKVYCEACYQKEVL